MIEPYSTEILWIVIIGFIIAFVLAFGIGANDVANSFGTSVGSGVLSLKAACILATFCEISGAVLIGYKVSDTMRKGILEVTLYDNNEKELMLGCLAALASSACWLLVATFLKLPISGTHSIVGSTIGFSLVAHGTQGLQWMTLATIVGSWFISPVLSGIMSTFLFWLIRKYILRANNALKAGLFSLPLFYGVTVFVNVLSIVLDGPKLLYMDNIPWWIALLASLAVGVVVAILIQIFVVPAQKKKILKRTTQGNKPVKFTLEGSTESSPSGSPKRNRRPLSLVCEGKQLPAITETTELVSLTTSSPKENGFSELNTKKSVDINYAKTCNTLPPNGNYKIDPEIIRKAENLLGKTSLDNTDLTITSLNYIDETQNGIASNTKYLQNFFEQKNQILQESFNNNKDLQSFNGKTPSPNSDSTLPISEVPNNIVNNKNELLPNKNELKNIESEISLELMISSTLSPNSSKVPLIECKDSQGPSKPSAKDDEESEEVSALFSFLQILTATFGSFAHGGNDVSNAIGPLIALYMVYKEGSVLQKSETPISILIYGGIGISVGLWLWGRRVIETIGNDLTKITPSTGFTIEIGAAFTVLLASKIGLPISTTHCKVGSVVFVGYFSSKKTPASVQDEERNEIADNAPKAVDWHLFRNIVYAWVVTVPVAALLSAGIMFVLCQLVL